MTDKEKTERIAFLKAEIGKKNEEIEELTKDADNFNAMQLALKLCLNSTYGATANKHFVCFCNGVASTITAHGRDLTRTMNNANEQYWYEQFHNDKELHSEMFVFSKVLDYITNNSLDLRAIIKEDKTHDGLYTKEYDKIKAEVTKELEIPDMSITPLDSRYINWATKTELEDPTWEQIYKKTGEAVRAEPVSIYADTDSLSADTIIVTDHGRYTIENLYDTNIKSGSAGNTLSGHESVKCLQKALNYSEDKGLYYGKVKRVIRHKVKKAKWRIKTKTGKEIFVTNDHSMIVFRDGVQLEVKPSDILKSDKILIVIEPSNV